MWQNWPLNRTWINCNNTRRSNKQPHTYVCSSCFHFLMPSSRYSGMSPAQFRYLILSKATNEFWYSTDKFCWLLRNKTVQQRQIHHFKFVVGTSTSFKSLCQSNHVYSSIDDFEKTLIFSQTNTTWCIQIII